MLRTNRAFKRISRSTNGSRYIKAARICWMARIKVSAKATKICNYRRAIWATSASRTANKYIRGSLRNPSSKPLQFSSKIHSTQRSGTSRTYKLKHHSTSKSNFHRKAPLTCSMRTHTSCRPAFGGTTSWSSISYLTPRTTRCRLFCSSCSPQSWWSSL